MICRSENLPVAVGIPVRDEADRLPRLLDALCDQSAGAGAFTVCFLMDGCSDESEALLRAAAPRLTFDVKISSLPRAEPNAGRARHMAMQMCLDAIGTQGGIVLTTDGDSVPEPDWIETARRALSEVDVVVGHIERNIRLMGCWRTRLEDYLDALHAMRRAVDPIAWDAAPSHPSLGGANLGFRADVYRALGGFPAYVRGEDTALVSKARREGYRVRHDPAVRVYTSNRTAGRAPGGLADELRVQLHSDLPPLVADPAVCLRHYRLQAALRRAHEAGPAAVVAAARRFGYCEMHLRDVAREVRTSDAFVEIIAPADCVGRSDVLPLPAAEEALRELQTPQPETAVA